MTRLDTHLKQISLSAAAIADLPFPPPKIFTNALLHPHDITTLIRDTEAHERALFSVATASETTVGDVSRYGGRRKPAYVDATTGAGVQRRAFRSQTAVAAVLGGDMAKQLKDVGVADSANGLGFRETQDKERNGLDVEVLLKGSVERISSFRARYSQLTWSIRRYESIVAEQSSKLSRMRQSDGRIEDVSDEEIGTASLEEEADEITEEDLRREEEEIKALEMKKRNLEERVNGMERDLGGLLR
ncbi:MAG: hypothetical protein M1816_003840 [Peltula sp. TS41687]|nr:MAG: hypothetical protein M1816_003840 [Peltula sp. TS41687]